MLCEQINFCDLRPIPSDATAVSDWKMDLILWHLLGTENLEEHLSMKSGASRTSQTKINILWHFETYDRSSWKGKTRRESEKSGVIKSLKCLCVDEYFTV